MPTFDKKKYAKRAMLRASSGFYSVEHFIRSMKGGTDIWSRSFYLLMSYHVELMLKSFVALVTKKNSHLAFNKELKLLGHDLQKIWKHISKCNSQKIELGIRDITKSVSNNFIFYTLETSSNRKIVIQDFSDVRYDFMKDELRKGVSNEIKILRGDIQSLTKILKETKILLE